MMLKLQKSYKWKLFSIITCGVLLSLGYFSLSFYSIPEKANAVTWYQEETRTIKNITTMQDMNSKICKNTKASDDEVVLTDIRDNSTYTVKKIGERCWMTQNLRIVNKTIYGSDIPGHEQDSNLAPGASYAIPVSSLWSDTDNTTIQKVYYNGNTTNGAYYSWCTATANNCSSATSQGAEVSYDICPRGWQLPSSKAGTGTNDFAVVAGLISTNVTYNTNYLSYLTNPSFNDDALSVNSVSWSAAGDALKGSLNNVGSVGYYWSRTAQTSANAHNLYFDSNYFYPSGSAARYFGFTIRCIAKETAEESHTTSTSGDINVKIDSTLTLDAVTGPDTINVIYTKVATGEIIATVSTNALSYNVLLSATRPNLTSKSGEIVPASSNVTAGNSAWGILNSATEESYVPITTTPSTYYNNKVFNPSTQDYTHTFTLGISAAPSLPADIYTTDVTVTVATT